MKLVSQSGMWFEVILLCLMPYNFQNRIVPPDFKINGDAWIVPSNNPLPGTEIVTITYETADVMLSLMTFRIYFLL